LTGVQMAEQMEVEQKALVASPPKIKADDDAENEGLWMKLADLRFRVANRKGNTEARDKDWAEFLEIAKKFNAVAVYEAACKDAGLPQDAKLLEQMRADVASRIKEVDDAIKDAKENEGDMEVRDGMMAKAQILARTSDKDTAVAAYAEAAALPKTTSSQKLDIEFHLMRLGLFWNDIPMLDAHVQASQTLVDNGGDWERRNRLKVYEATYRLAVRDFKKAATLLLDSISTFTATELYGYSRFVFFTVVCATVSLDRGTIRKKVIHAPEILQVIDENPEIRELMNSLYGCKYRDYLVALVAVVDQLQLDRYLAPHAAFFLRQARIVAYKQYLESYFTVSLPSMASTFGVGQEFLDKELSDLVACGRLSCKIDKVKGVVESNRPDTRNALYQQTIKQGDLLLNRVQKLSRVITI